MAKSNWRRSISVAVLLITSVACSLNNSGPDTAATVNAVSTRVQETLIASGVNPPATLPPASIPAATHTPPSLITSTPLPIPATNTSAPLLFPCPTPPALTPAVADLTRTNGPAIHAMPCPTPPRIDGDLGEWILNSGVNQVVFKPENWSGSEDLTAPFAAAWDAAHLYLGVWVVDDVHAQTQQGALIYRGDSVEVLFDADLRGDLTDARLSADDYQLGFSPGALVGNNPEAYLWFPVAREGKPDGVVVAARQAGEGGDYYLEVAIPWSLFNITPTGGEQYGFALSVSDNDTPGAAEQQSMISTVPTRRLTDPTTWGTLVLDK